MIRSAPGAQLSEGRIRVDAARALAKLREYQLTDRTAWILEGLRGAVAAGATAITLDGDANDIWLAWEGPTLSEAELVGLFDELVSPEAATERHHVRFIAAAVNSALGMDPAYVDVYAMRPAGTVRARYRSEILEGAEALRQLAAEPTERPAGRADGMLVHLRRRVGLELIRFALDEPPELALARGACREIGVPLRVGSTVLHRSHLGRDVVRVALADLDGFLAVGAPAPHVVLTVAERGVALIDVPFDLGLAPTGRPQPFRAYLDGPRMPTNASRSDVRRTGHPIATAELRAREALPALVAALVAQVMADPDRQNPARRAALHVLASQTSPGTGWRAAATPPVLAPLLALPLVRTATGTPVPIGSIAWDPIAHTGPAPYPAELAPWLDAHMWIPPGDPAAVLYPPGAIQHGLLARGPMRRSARRARQGLERKRRFFEHAVRPAELTGSGYYIRARLGARVAHGGIDPRGLQEFAGEVALLRPDAATPGELVILHQGRVLERVPLSRAITTGVACAAVIESPRIVPHRDYRRAERGPAFDELIRVVRAAIAVLGEGLARALAGAPDSRFPIVGERDEDLERHLIRTIAIGLAEIGDVLSPLLCDAAVWRTVTGPCVSLTAIRGAAVIGTGRSGADVVPPGRIVLADPVDRATLRLIAPRTQVIDYAARPRVATADAMQLATRTAKTTGIALAISPHDRAWGAVGLAPGELSRVGISHTGVTLDEIPYRHELVPVVILVDDATIVPTADWRCIEGDAGITSRSFEDWERALLQAIAASLAGERPRELVGPPVSLDDRAGRALCEALAGPRGSSILSPELAAKLAASALFEVLGDPVRISARELAARPRLEYVTPEAVAAQPLPPGTRLDPAPLVASPHVAGLAASLAQLATRDTSDDLARLAREHRRRERLARLRATPPPEPAPRGLTVPLHGALQGVVGVGTGATTVVVRVEGRDFGHESRQGVPVEAIVELDEAHLDEELLAVLPATMTAIFESVRLAVPRLVEALVATQRETLATPGPGRTFLAAWLELARPEGPRRNELVTVALWPSVQSDRRVALTAAVREDGLWVATWTGEWLAPLADEEPDRLDEPVLLVDDGELSRIYHALFPGRLVDVSSLIQKLQARRRVLRGLAQRPMLPHAPAVLTRDLESLGEEGLALAPGQISLLDAPPARVYLHAGGELRACVALPVVPPVALAIEAPELVPPGASLDVDGLRAHDAVTAALQHPARELARLLVESIVATTPVSELAPAVRKQLARAAIAGMRTLARLPLFELLTPDPLDPPAWVGWDQLVAQEARGSAVWYVSTPPPERVPLDPARQVFVLDAGDAQLATAHGVAMVEATHELRLDATSRRNQAREKVTVLALPGPVLASITLDGDGVQRPRGVVGVLEPSRRFERVLREYRAGHPFDPSNDPCDWPTVAEVELESLTPDRTWSSPVHDPARERLVTAVREASRRALATYAPPVPDGVLSERVDDHACVGAVWLGGAPGARLGVRVLTPTDAFDFVPLHHLGLQGAFASLAPDPTNAMLNAVCHQAYVRLVRAQALALPTDDLGLSHVAFALVTGRIEHAPRAIRFPCFSPAPLDPAGLLAFFAGAGPLVVIDEHDDDPAVALVLDGSILCATLLSAIGNRRGERQRRARPRPPTASPRSFHRMQPLVDELQRRLGTVGIRVPAWAISDDSGPLLRWDHGRLVLAAAHPHALVIASHLLTRSPDADHLVDLLAAHAATVMNVALTDITDADERAALALLARPA